MVHVVCEEVVDEEMAEGDEEGVKEHTGTKKVAARPRDQPLLDRKAKEGPLAEGAGSPFTACPDISAGNALYSAPFAAARAVQNAFCPTVCQARTACADSQCREKPGQPLLLDI